MCTTYEYQCRVQILVILLHESLVVLLGLLTVKFVESSAEILLRRLRVPLLSVRGVNDGGQRDTKPSLPIYRTPTWFPASISPHHSSMIPATIGGQGTVMLGFP